MSTDMPAPRYVFGTNHDGKLDAGDAQFADFKIMAATRRQAASPGG